MEKDQKADIRAKHRKNASNAAAKEIEAAEQQECAKYQNKRITELAQELACRGFTAAPLVLVEHRTWTEREYGVAFGGTPMESWRTFITQFLCHIDWQNKSADTTKPRWGTPDRCFGLSYDRRGNNATLWVGYTDNRQFPERFDAHKYEHYPYAASIIQVLEMCIERTSA